jgi:glutathione S-transferase
MAESTNKILYWKGLLGRGEMVVQACILTGAPFERVDVTPEEIPKLSEGVDFWNLPILIKGDFKLSETSAIVKSLALEYKPEFIGKSIREKVEVTCLEGVLNDTMAAAFAPTTSEDYATKVPEALKGPVAKKLASVQKHLGSKTTLVGDYYTWADVLLIFTLELMKLMDAKLNVNAFDYSQFDNYMAKFMEIPGIKAHYDSPARKTMLHLFPQFCKLKID